ncbi:DNA gyrase subunit A [Clostridium thermosuccinogenes]|jgi:DNA gyrase subunit A|uniref:DNA gyrase subunit A n=1 Tax=Clostridium thermosuccinogenes TaxID=84032 RepID=A0A2K2F984_9CLOT|nr:DNA gyrase subunit A [Pseudoclostridium thermosuccinogenes]AUS98507.1 DNA gyrase subunit A [Pseudoclostridium thermosuccinogenes]PNT90829.1 DNA gyrase subunit A [Pseudoclostridium thermosuccinogenes]PNT94759.1 DNA gyrase subunit A [Pseudoclostridium thermosuccinogenes]PNT95336.1 DNA gyrase subunit A [Pseudoclostridium thermosuccinogenes]
MADNTNEIREQKIIPVNIESEMKKSFMQYAMSVIIERALPDIRDGLKPVHRRILYAMYELGFTPDKAYRKCATTVGEVLGKFHPHGDAAVYDSLVRMAQDFSLRHILIDGHGNFGSRDGDPAAAMRYTEARLSKMAMEMLTDINKDTVDFKPNFDEHEMEPVVLPSRFPNLLVNGSSGIAVGMATNIPPHNLGEVIDGIIKIIDNPDISLDELMKTIKGPDFPTAGIIVGRQGIREAYRTGKGRITLRAETVIEQVSSTKQRIIVTELPYQVNKARLIEKIAELVKEKRIEGIADLRDESGREEPVRIVIDLKKDANANVVLNLLYKNTQMQDTFSVNMLAIVETEDKKYEPRIVNLRQAIDYYIKHQEDVIIRRTKFDLDKAEARAHILEGLKIALDHLDEVIKIIRNSKTEADAKQGLMDSFGLSEKQSQAIVDMRLGRLTGLEREKIENEYRELLERIKYFKDVLANESMVLKIIKDELTVIKEKYADERRTKIIADEDEIDIEDLIQEEESAITLTHFGYIKRMPADTYKSQKRGGKGIIGLSTREEDFVENLFTASTHHFLLFFTNKGKVHRLKAYEIPEGSRQAKGTAIVNLLQLDADEKVTTVIPVAEYKEDSYLIMATKHGLIKKTKLMEYDNIRKGGLTGVALRENDELIDVKLTDGDKDIILVTRNGMSIRFNENDVRPVGRVAQGVIGVKLEDDDSVIGMEVCCNDPYLLVVTEKGFGKRTELEEYKVQSRGGKGILTYRVTEKTGKVVGMKLVDDNDDIMLISQDGTIIRMNVDDISVLGRATQGVTLMRVGEGNNVACIAKIVPETDSEDDNEE